MKHTRRLLGFTSIVDLWCDTYFVVVVVGGYLRAYSKVAIVERIYE